MINTIRRDVSRWSTYERGLRELLRDDVYLDKVNLTQSEPLPTPRPLENRSRGITP